MSDNSYRVCVLDFEGHVLFSRMVRCDDDLDALQQAEMDCAGHPVEVWHQARLVARVKANNAPLNAMDRTSL